MDVHHSTTGYIGLNDSLVKLPSTSAIQVTWPGRVRRTPDIHFSVRDVAKPDVGLLLRGSIAFATHVEVTGTIGDTQREHILSEDDLAVLTQVEQSRWTSLDEAIGENQFEKETIRSLLDRGLLLGDTNDSAAVDAAPQDSNRSALGWNRYASLYHNMSRWHAPQRRDSTDGEEHHASPFDQGNLFENLLARHGPPPSEFHSFESDHDPVALPIIEKTGSLFELLKTRETVREFNVDQSLPRDAFSALLYFTFGCHGTKELAKDVIALKKYSPSGGALHPIEAYPLVLNVEGIPTGLYHYNVEHHRLDVIREMDLASARELAAGVTADQDWFAGAHCMVLLTGRFDRLFWKYRNNSKAYKVLFLDAGHLSQTFYLLCTEMGLGAFFTAAINDAKIEESLGLMLDREGAIGVCGCGVVGPESKLRFDYQPYRADPADG